MSIFATAAAARRQATIQTALTTLAGMRNELDRSREADADLYRLRIALQTVGRGRQVVVGPAMMPLFAEMPPETLALLGAAETAIGTWMIVIARQLGAGGAVMDLAGLPAEPLADLTLTQRAVILAACVDPPQAPAPPVALVAEPGDPTCR